MIPEVRAILRDQNGQAKTMTNLTYGHIVLGMDDIAEESY